MVLLASAAEGDKVVQVTYPNFECVKTKLENPRNKWQGMVLWI